MNTRFSKLGFLLLGAAVLIIGCAKKKGEEEAVLPSTVPFTAADIAKVWNSNCTAKVDAALGTTHFKIQLTLNANGTFSFNEYQYYASSCSNATYRTYYSVSGTYAVGAATTGGQALTFTTTGNSNLTVMNAADNSLVATQNAFNSDCGGTSPYCTIVGSSCTNNGTASGVGKNSSTMSCMSRVFPTNNTTLHNIASFSGTNFYIGAPTTGVPGVFHAGSTPSSATLFLY